MTTKSQVRSDWAYARHLMRLADVALKNDDTEELRVLALDLSAAASGLIGYLEERGQNL